MSVAAKKLFFAFYYRWCRLLNRAFPYMRFGGMTVYFSPGVYRLVYNLHEIVSEVCRPGARVLEVGCGSGVLSIAAARRASEVVAVDISPLAIENTKLNCERNGLQNVTVLESDMYADVQGPFDIIISNAPVASSSLDVEMKSKDDQFATSAGFLDRFFGDDLPLAEGGVILVTVPSCRRNEVVRLALARNLDLVRAWPTKAVGAIPFLLPLVYLEVGVPQIGLEFRRRAKSSGAEMD